MSGRGTFGVLACVLVLGAAVGPAAAPARGPGAHGRKGSSRQVAPAPSPSRGGTRNDEAPAPTPADDGARESRRGERRAAPTRAGGRGRERSRDTWRAGRSTSGGAQGGDRPGGGNTGASDTSGGGLPDGGTSGGGTGGDDKLGSGGTSGAGQGPGPIPGGLPGGGSSGTTVGPGTPGTTGTAPIPGALPGGTLVPAAGAVPSIAPPAIPLPRIGGGVENALVSGGAFADALLGPLGTAAARAGLGALLPPGMPGALAAAAPALLTPADFTALAAAIAATLTGARVERAGARTPTLFGDVLAGVPAGVWLVLAGLGGLSLFFAGTTAVATAASQRRGRALSQVESLAVTDSLTGLLMRGALEHRLAAEVGRARRYNRPVSVVFFDVRGLKQVNDLHGHGAGDRLLREVGALLNATSRDHDVCGRIGGDECVVVLPEDDGAGAEAFRDRVHASLPQARANLGLTTDWDLTSGVATFPQDGETPRELLDAADRRLYQHRGIEIDPPSA